VATDARENLSVLFEFQAGECRRLGSGFYGDLCELLARDAEAGGPVVPALGEYANEHFDRAYHLRLLAALHRMAITGESPELRAHYPSTGGDGDATAAWPAVAAVLAARPFTLVDALRRPLQTNEVGRAAPLASGFAVVARRTGLPLRLLEVGSSAGLNLRLDRFWFEADGAGWGDAASKVRFVDQWDGGAPPFASATPIASRRGCDLAPVDLADPESEVRLLSFVWPGQADRFVRLQDALAIARDMPVDIDRAAVDDWLPAQLASRVPGVATVVFHSIVWQYLPAETRTRVVETIDAAGEAATDDAPIAWVRLEPAPKYAHAELQATIWPGGERQLLATTGFHAGRITWRA
jgi:hypothetical protein